MSTLRHDFNDIAATKAARKVPPPFSLRLTAEERARLEADAAGKPLGAYVRSRLFGEEATPRKRKGKSPLKDQEALGRVLGALGRSSLSSNLNQLARAVNTGTLPVHPETEAELRNACQDIKAIRADLLQALGRDGSAP
jgi:hypothetical protein